MNSTDNMKLNSWIARFHLPMILGAAFLLRIIHLAVVNNLDLVKIPIIDSAYYHLMASDIAAGNLAGEGIFFMSPLYPYLCGLIYAVFGAMPIWVMLLQCALSVGTIFQLYKFAHKLLDRRTAAITAALAAIYVPFIFYDSTLLTASLILFLSSLILNYSLDSLNDSRRRILWKLGLTIGLSALARPLVLIFIPFLMLAQLLNGRKDWLKRSFVIMLATVVILFPIGIRNLIVGEEFVMTSSSGGMNFYVGNNAEATGIYWEAPFLSSYEPWNEEVEYRRHASEQSEKQLSAREAGRYWMRQSFDWMASNPSDYLQLILRKSLYFFNRAEFANNVSIYHAKDVSPLLRFNPIGFWLICPLGLAGMILLWRHNGWRRTQILWLWLIAYFAGAIIIFNAAEYRLPAVLVLICGAAYSITVLYDRFRKGNVESALRIIVLVLLFMPMVNLRTTFIRSGENARMDYFNYGNTLLKLGETEESIERFQNALAIDPYFAEGLHRLADAYYRTGQADKAVDIGRRIGLENPASIIEIIKSEAQVEGYALLQEGKLRKALAEFTAGGMTLAEAAAETLRITNLNLARVKYSEGDKEKALHIFREIRELDNQVDPSIAYNIGMLHWQFGNTDSAEFYAGEVLSMDSLNVHAGYLMAKIYKSTNREDLARKLISKVNPDSKQHHGLLEDVRKKLDDLTLQQKWLDALQIYGTYGKLGYEIEPEDKLRIARLQIEVNNFDQALDLMIPLKGKYSSSAELHYLIGRALFGQGQIDEAWESIRQSVTSDRDYIPPRIMFARHYMKLGKIKAAMKEMEDVSHLDIIEESLFREYHTLMDSLRRL